MRRERDTVKSKESHPAWVCGLKLKSKFGDEVVSKVTPCVGVWIETCQWKNQKHCRLVTPCVGVWIETENN